jgi:hypothetical protein
MIIDKGVHTFSAPFADVWNNEYVTKDIVLHGFWYDKLFVGSRTYLLKNDKPHDYIFSHLILASKFSMPPTSHIMKGKYASYELLLKVMDIILDVIKAIELLD